MTPEQFAAGLEQLDNHLAQHPYVDGRVRTRGDVLLQVGLRCLGPIKDLVTLVDGYRARGAQRVVASLAISSSSFERRLSEVADALGIVPPPSVLGGR
jgi:hypothetical protein